MYDDLARREVVAFARSEASRNHRRAEHARLGIDPAEGEPGVYEEVANAYNRLADSIAAAPAPAPATAPAPAAQQSTAQAEPDGWIVRYEGKDYFAPDRETAESYRDMPGYTITPVYAAPAVPAATGSLVEALRKCHAWFAAIRNRLIYHPDLQAEVSDHMTAIVRALAAHRAPPAPPNCPDGDA